MDFTALRHRAFFKQNPKVALRTIDRLRAIDAWLRTPKSEGGAGVPSKDSDNTLLLATWNLRDFGRKGARGYGERTLESLYYIAAFISAFDLVAVQEVNDDLDLFNTLRGILGRNWDFIATDTSPGKAGNDERMVFLFDTRKVRFRSIAGEITLLEEELIRLSEQKADMPAGSKLYPRGRNRNRYTGRNSPQATRRFEDPQRAAVRANAFPRVLPGRVVQVQPLHRAYALW